MPGETPDETAALAQRLLDAQVAFHLDELGGDRGTALVAEEARELLEALAEVPVGELLDREAVRTTAREFIGAVGPSPAVAALVTELVPVLRDLDASAEQRLGAVVPRERVEQVVAVLTRSETLRDRVMHRLGESPMVSVLAMRFVSALVGDAVQQNRERAEKVPGMKSLLGMGDFAARQAKGMAPKQLEQMVGGAADRGTQAAMERVSRALVDTFDEEAVEAAVLEVWDLHAEESVAELRAYLEDDELAAVVDAGHDVWLDLHTTTWFRAVVDAVIDALFDMYGELTVGELLGEVGVDHDLVVAEVERHAPTIIAALQRDGRMEAFLRRRLAPFYASDAAHEVLSSA